MSTSYPGALDSFTTKVDNVDSVMAAHVNNPQDSIVALETLVGVTGSAVSSTLVYKIAAIQTALALLTYTTTFVNASLSSHILTVTHNLAQELVTVQVYNNSNQMVIPDQITLTGTNTLTIDFTSLGTLTGTWSVIVQA